VARLNTTVFVVDPDGRDRPFGPGEDLPDWAAEQISNPDVWDGEPPTRTHGDQGGTGQQAPATQTPAPGKEPPRSGKGSGRDAWAAYAVQRGVDVNDDATRDDVIDLLAERGLIDADR
jgi:hypothetical protein